MKEEQVEKLKDRIGENNIFYDLNKGVHFVLAEKVLEYCLSKEKEKKKQVEKFKEEIDKRIKKAKELKSDDNLIMRFVDVIYGDIKLLIKRCFRD